MKNNTNIKQNTNDLSAEVSKEEYKYISIKREDAKNTTRTDNFRNKVSCGSQNIEQATDFPNDEQGEYMTETMNYDICIKEEDSVYEDVKTDNEDNLNPEWVEDENAKDVKCTVTVDVASNKVNYGSGQTTVELDKHPNDINCGYEHGKCDPSEVMKYDRDIKDDKKTDLEDADLKLDKVTYKDNTEASESVRRYQCIFCEYKAARRDTLTRHFKAKHDKNHLYLQHDESAELYQCKFCEFKTKSKSSLKEHFTRKHDTFADWYECHLCEFKTKIKYLLTRHFRRNHNYNQDIEWHQCQHCPLKTKDKASLKKHFIHKHDDTIEWYHCEMCEFKTKYKSQVKLHFKAKHENKQDSKLPQQHDENDKWYQCRLCSFRTKYREHLKEHLEHQHHNTVVQKLHSLLYNKLSKNHSPHLGDTVCTPITDSKPVLKKSYPIEEKCQPSGLSTS